MLVVILLVARWLYCWWLYCWLLGDYYLRLLLEEDETEEEYSAIKRSSVSAITATLTYLLCPRRDTAIRPSVCPMAQLP